MKRQTSHHLVCAIGLTVILAMSMPQAAHAATGPRCYVDKDALGGNDGNSWSSAFVGLQSALSDANCREVWVAEGTYTPGAPNTNVFALYRDAKIYGGFAGTETLLADRDPWTQRTILSGDMYDDDNDGGDNIAALATEVVAPNNLRVLYFSGVTSATVLDGFIITAGNGTWGGAGVYCNGQNHSICSPTLANLIFSGNHATAGGGALYVDPRVGGLAKPVLTNVTFTGNDAPAGGAVYNMGTDGGVSSPTFTNVSFIGNAATSAGAIYNDGRNGESSPVLKNVTFANNTASVRGGAMYNLGGTAPDTGIVQPKLTNVTFHGNSAGLGGAIYDDGNNGTLSPKLTNVILWGNTASTSGNQMYDDAAAAPVIKYSVVAGGDAGIVGGVGTPFSSGIGNTSADPKLMALDDYGGLTETMLPIAGSSAINAGLATACPSKDQRGIPRPQGGRCDIGATEAQYKTFKSSASQDGWVLESSSGSNAGGSHNAGAGTLRVGYDEADRQYRSIVSFNTATLGSAAQITSVIGKLRSSGAAGDPWATLGDLSGDCQVGPFGASAVLEDQDYEAAHWNDSVLDFDPTPVAGWYMGSIESWLFGCINQTGLTQFKLRFFTLAFDGDTDADYIKVKSGNALAGQRPQLIVYYYVP